MRVQFVNTLHMKDTLPYTTIIIVKVVVAVAVAAVMMVVVYVVFRRYISIFTG